MSKIISLSEAVSIAIHGMILIAQSEKPVSVKQIADMNGSSRHHAAKVFQRLVKEDFVKSNRGPTGGFILNRNPDEVTFLDIFEIIEGKIEIAKCPNNKPVCPFEKCIFNSKIKDLTIEFQEYLESQKLSDYILQE